MPSHNPPGVPSQPVLSPASPAPGAQPAAAESAAVPARGTSGLAANLKIDGEISGNSDLYIDGEIQGTIRMAGARVTVGLKGRIYADIEAREIAIHGAVEGSLHAAESVHLGAPSRVQGGVFAPRIRIDEGAFLRGTAETVLASAATTAAARPRETDVEARRPVSVGANHEPNTP